MWKKGERRNIHITASVKAANYNKLYAQKKKKKIEKKSGKYKKLISDIWKKWNNTNLIPIIAGKKK